MGIPVGAFSLEIGVDGPRFRFHPKQLSLAATLSEPWQHRMCGGAEIRTVTLTHPKAAALIVHLVGADGVAVIAHSIEPTPTLCEYCRGEDDAQFIVGDEWADRVPELLGT